MPIPKPPHPAQLHRQMVGLVQAGRTPTQLAAEFDCSAQSSSTAARRASRTGWRKPPPTMASPSAARTCWAQR